MSETLTYTDRMANTIEITPNDEWVNYGDVNPIRHGGMFIRWDNGHWEIVETRHGYDYPDEYPNDDQVEVTYYYLDEYDVFEGGDPDNGPSDYLKHEINALSNVSGYENALVDYDIEYFLHGYTHWAHGDRQTVIDESEYWTHLEDKFGITEN
jgi:hypothetical protein